MTVHADAESVLRSAQTVLLIDWRSPAVPYGLARAGFTVLSANVAAGTGASYTAHDMEPAPTAEGARVYGPEQTGGPGWLLLTPLADLPLSADLVVAYRPSPELPGIVETASRLGAGVWVEPDATSSQARHMAESAGIVYVEGTPILEALARHHA